MCVWQKIVNQIGKGAVGRVFRGLDVEANTSVALKVVDLYHINEDELEAIQVGPTVMRGPPCRAVSLPLHPLRVQSEVKLLRSLQHPNIVKFVEALRTEHHLCIVLEYVCVACAYNTDTCTHAHRDTCTHTHTHTCTHRHLHTDTTHVHMHARTPGRMHAHGHLHTHTHAHAVTHAQSSTTHAIMRRQPPPPPPLTERVGRGDFSRTDSPTRLPLRSP